MILTKQQRIEYLCEQEIPDYAFVKPGRELSLVALSLGKSPRRIDADDKARIMAAADALRADLSVKTDAEISTIFDDAKAKEWRGKHLTIVEAAQTIADKLFPVDPYEWTLGQRADCAASYQAHLKTFVLRNGVAFISPHDQKPFDLSRLSAVNFPADGLIRAADLHLCLRGSDPNNGHFPVPPKPVSKAPPPITPLTLTSSRSYSRREMESAPDEQLPLTAPALAPSLAAWEAKDLWSAGQFAILLCGAEPENRKTRLSNRAIENAVRAIELAVAVESLTVAHLEQDPRDWSTFSAPAIVRYFRPADAITWANKRRAEFSYFPQFVARNDRPGEPISTDENLSAPEELVSNGGPVDWIKWNRMRSLRPDEAAKLISCIDPIRWKGDHYAQGPIPQTLQDKIEHCREHLSRIDDKWTFAKLAEELPGELPAGMLEAMRPQEAPALATLPMSANPAHIATQGELVEAFKCRPSLFENGRKYPWFIEARTAGTGRRKGTPPLYDPIAFATHLPKTDYGNGISERDAYRALKRHFPEQYEDIEHLIPDEMK